MPDPLVAHFAPALRTMLADVACVADRSSGDLLQADYAIAIAPGLGELARLAALRCVIAPGAGVDHILADTRYPAAVPLVRLVQPDLLQRMSEYVILHVLRHHRQVTEYEAQQRAGVWQVLWPQKAAQERNVGVMGLGELGSPIAQHLAQLGFRTSGWSRTPKAIDAVRTYAGRAELAAFLADVEILVNLLPATPETANILDRETIALLPTGASLINAGRGSTVDDSALLEALDTGALSNATLDVFSEEPLPPEHRYWSHPRVAMTPHCASAITAEALAVGVRAVIEAVRDGRAPPQLIDRTRGY